MTVVNNEQLDFIRRTIAQSVEYGKTLQSEQTGFIHYCYHQNDDVVHYPIPTYENMLFSLALIRSHTSENVSEGMRILEALLPFQSGEGESEGNFPIYLHQYPRCHDRFQGVKLLLPLAYLLRQYDKIIEKGLKKRVHACVHRICEHALSMQVTRPGDYSTTLKVAACLVYLGKFFEQEKWLSFGQQLLDELQQRGGILHGITRMSWGRSSLRFFCCILQFKSRHGVLFGNTCSGLGIL